MLALDLIVGSGGVLSHAPGREQAALMMVDAYQPEGFTQLAVDSIFMMPQLGILSTIYPEAATQVFDRDCLIKLGTVVAPVGTAREGEEIATVGVGSQTLSLRSGSLLVRPLGVGEVVEVEVRPARGFDAGEGRGRAVRRRAEGGVVGLILDGRGRPLSLPPADDARVARLREWLGALNSPVPKK
jgi:hypothetical protein